MLLTELCRQLKVGEKVKRVLKIIGLLILFVSMAYASNWDLPKEEKIEVSETLIQEYEEILKGENINEN